MNTQLPPERHREPWTEDEDKKLLIEWSSSSIFAIAEKMNRTPWAVAQRARFLKLGPFSRGVGVSMREFERYSGFSNMKIEAAARALNLLLRRIIPSDPKHRAPKRPYMITDEQQEALLEYMLATPLAYANKKGARRTTKGLWGVGRKPKRCRTCKRDDRPHFAKGQCRFCYNTKYKKKAKMNTPISSFRNANRFLSNFYPYTMEFEGKKYYSIEHAFQAAKTLDLEKRQPLQLAYGTELSWNPGKARVYGRKIPLREGWDDMRIGVMRDLLRIKFSDYTLSKMLLATGDRELIEGNTWGDRFWGVDGTGENWLGKLLMEVRKELQDAGLGT